MNFYIFNIYSEKESVYTNTVLFDFGNDYSFDSLKQELRNFFTFNYKTQFLCFITPVKNAQRKELIEKKLSEIGIDVVFAFYHDNGICEISDSKINVAKLEDFKRQGLNHIFEKNNGVLQSDDSFHFVLPSGKHSKFFLRVGNILNEHAEIFFISFCMLQHIKNDHLKIYYDTSSILNLIIATIQLRKNLSNFQDFELIGFGSYDRIDDIDFEPHSLVFISASNSGNLQSKLKGIEPSLDIVTLIFNGINSEVAHLLNVTNHKFIIGQKQFEQDESCEYCKLNSIPVSISGEQFLPLTFAKERVLISKDCAPEWLNAFLDEFAYKDVIKCNYKEGRKKREFYLDLTLLNRKLKNAFSKEVDQFETSYEAEFVKKIKNIVPFSLRYIIYLSDNASKEMATVIFDAIKDKVKDLQAPISFDDISGLSENEKCSCLIVSSTIATGNKLNVISKQLRAFENMSLIYLVGIFRTTTYKSFKNLKSNLIVRDDKISMNGVHFLQIIHLPDNHSNYNNELYKSPWEIEQIKLTKALSDPRFTDYYEIIETRLEYLNQNGLQNNLFWFNPMKTDEDRELSLNKSFAFYRFEDNSFCKLQGEFKQPPQSEIYFAVSSIIHNLRNLSDNDVVLKKGKRNSIKPLIQHEHMRSVLSPENFVRFNDGIIQASILRSARPSELNYSIDEKLSHEMKTKLINFFSNPNSYTSESILEFLYAFWVKKIRLSANDEKELFEHFRTIYKDVKEVMFFLTLISSSSQ